MSFFFWVTKRPAEEVGIESRVLGSNQQTVRQWSGRGENKNNYSFNAMLTQRESKEIKSETIKPSKKTNVSRDIVGCVAESESDYRIFVSSQSSLGLFAF